MTDPLSLTPFALAANGGRVDGHSASRLVAAGLGVLQRSAALVSALSGRRSGIFLPPSHRVVTALAASDGRAAVLLNADVLSQLAPHDVGAVFTLASLADRLPEGMTRVLVDEAPEEVRVVWPGGDRVIPLTSHDALDLAGDPDVDGAREPVVADPDGLVTTHRQLLSSARNLATQRSLGGGDHLLAVSPWTTSRGLMTGLVAPLVAGASVSCMQEFDPATAADLIERGEITGVVAHAEAWVSLATYLRDRGTPLAAPALRLRLVDGEAPGTPADLAMLLGGALAHCATPVGPA